MRLMQEGAWDVATALWSGSTETLYPVHIPPALSCPRRALTIQGRDDGLPQGQDEPQRAPEEEKVCNLKVELPHSPCAVQHGGAARTAGAGLVPQHTGMEAADGGLVRSHHTPG